MDIKKISFVAGALVIGFASGYFIANQLSINSMGSVMKNVSSFGQSKDDLFESAVNQCLKLAQNVYLRDFINLCKEDQPSSLCDGTDLNSASGYGLYQLGANPDGKFSILYKTYESDMNTCTHNSK